MPLGLEEQFTAVNTATQFARLLSLDSVWTGYLQSATPAISEHDVEQLRRITDEMTQLLREAPDRAGYQLRQIEYYTLDSGRRRTSEVHCSPSPPFFDSEHPNGPIIRPESIGGGELSTARAPLTASAPGLFCGATQAETVSRVRAK